MRTTAELDAEQWVLSSAEGQRLLAQVSAVPSPGPTEITRWRRDQPREVVEAALRLALARRRGASKFARASEMWLDPIGLEQATSETVARHKARRFAGENVVDLCSGIGGDTLALAAESMVTCVDADEGMCRRVAWNARVYEVGEHITVVQGQVEETCIPEGVLVHIDPDRRAGSAKRARTLSEYVPGLGFLISLFRNTRGGAIKLSPASDFATHFGDQPVEMELISLGGECKEATIWYGDLVTCRKRATALPSRVTWTDRDHALTDSVACSDVLRWVFDPDPALIRAGLVDSFAMVHSLARVAPGIDYLTGPECLATPFLSAFEVAETLPLDLKRLKRFLVQEQIGPLEIKVRGLDLRPEALRAQLRLAGNRPATLLLVGGRGPSRAIVALRRNGALPGIG